MDGLGCFFDDFLGFFLAGLRIRLHGRYLPVHGSVHLQHRGAGPRRLQLDLVELYRELKVKSRRGDRKKLGHPARSCDRLGSFVRKARFGVGAFDRRREEMLGYWIRSTGLGGDQR